MQERMVTSLESINDGINDLRNAINRRLDNSWLDNSMPGAPERKCSELTVRKSSVFTAGSSAHGTALDSTRTGDSAFSLLSLDDASSQRRRRW